MMARARWGCTSRSSCAREGAGGGGGGGSGGAECGAGGAGAGAEVEAVVELGVVAVGARRAARAVAACPLPALAINNKKSDRVTRPRHPTWLGPNVPGWFLFDRLKVRRPFFDGCHGDLCFIGPRLWH